MDSEENKPERARLGDFEIHEELGRGGMGVVYRALQLSLDRRVALKVLKGSFTLMPSSVERFKREAAAAARLHHTNIVPVYATGTYEDQHYYAMELIEGSSLDRVLDQIRATQHTPELKVPPEKIVQNDDFDLLAETVVENNIREGVSITATRASVHATTGLTSGRQYFDSVARMIADVADALDYAHKQGVVHRDIKPGNLILSGENRIYVTDFGLARLQEAEGLTATGGVMGSPHYMSPEQVTPDHPELDHRTDVYSLGVTLYELITLQAPFKGVSKEMVMNHIITTEPARPRRLDRHVPQDLETICLKAMEKRPDRRYQTAGEFADDLRRYVNRFAISARRVSLAERAFRWSQRHPSTAGLIAATVVAMAALTGLWLVNMYRVMAQDANKALEASLVIVEEARREADQQKYFGQYVVNIIGANHALENNDGPTAEALVQAIANDPGQRSMIGFEWGYLARQVQGWQGTNIRRDPTGRSYGCDFSPDDRILALAGGGVAIDLLYGMPKPTNEVALEGHEGPLNAVVFSPNGERLASASDDGMIGIWDMTRQPPSRVTWLRGHYQPVVDVSFDPKGQRLASGGAGGTVRVWDVEKGVELKTLKGHEGKVWSVAFSPADGGRLVSGGADGTVRVWSTESYEELGRSKNFEGAIMGVDFSPDGSMIVSGGLDDLVRLWEAEDLSELASMSGHESGVRHVCFSPTGRWIASSSQDRTVRLWDVATRSEFQMFQGHHGEVIESSFAEDERGLASVGLDGVAKLWDLGGIGEMKPTTLRASGQVWSTTYSRDGRMLASVESESGAYRTKTLRIWKGKDGLESWELTRWTDSIYGAFSECDFSPTGSLLASCMKNEVLLWDTDQNEIVSRWVCSEDDLAGAVFSADGNLLAVWGLDGVVRLYDPSTRKLRQEFKAEEEGRQVFKVRFTPDGKYVVSVARGGGNEITVRDLQTLAVVGVIAPEGGYEVTTIAIAPDSSGIAVGTHNGRLNLWSLDTFEPMFAHWEQAHLNRVNALAFLDHGRSLVSASRDNKLKFWNLVMNREVVTIDVLSGNEQISSTGITDFSVIPDEESFLSASGEPEIRVWARAATPD